MKSLDTKTALLNCAEDLIQRVGVNAMSYSHLSKAVGITKASIHHHFPKKEDLIISLLVKYETTYGHAYSEVVESRKPALEKLVSIANIFENSLRNNKVCLFGMIGSEQATLSSEIQKILKEGFEKTVYIYEKIFIQGKAEEKISEEIDTYTAAYNFLAFLIGAQILSRTIGNVEVFDKAIIEYVETLKK